MHATSERTVSRTLVASSNAPTVAIGTESRVRVLFLRTQDAHTANHGLTDAMPMRTSSQRDGAYNRAQQPTQPDGHNITALPTRTRSRSWGSSQRAVAHTRVSSSACAHKLRRRLAARLQYLSPPRKHTARRHRAALPLCSAEHRAGPVGRPPCRRRTRPRSACRCARRSRPCFAYGERRCFRSSCRPRRATGCRTRAW